MNIQNSQLDRYQEQLEGDIDLAKENLSKAKENKSLLRKIQKEFPDLSVSKERLVSKQANSKVTDVDLKEYGIEKRNGEFRFDFYVSPYLTIEGHRVYCDPLELHVIEGYPTRELKNWHKDAVTLGIPDTVITKIEKMIPKIIREEEARLDLYSY